MASITIGENVALAKRRGGPRLAAVASCLLCLLPGAASAERAADGLLALYTFEAEDGAVVRDRSGAGEPLDLTIEPASAVQWRDGALVVRSAAKIVSRGPARKIVLAVQRSNSVTVEAWVRSQSDRQSGPARMVTISDSPNRRNLTLGQDGDRYDVRLRTTSTSENGIPSTATGGLLKPQLTHVVFTRDVRGQAKIFIDGKQQADKRVAGRLDNWSDRFQLALANELSGDRPWLGELHLVALYGRALSPEEVRQNFEAGAGADTPAVEPADLAAQHFERQVAAILANQCLECHDASTRKGGLDLSHRQAALAGGESGPPLVPGKPDDSLLWQYVEADEMPLKRTPLDDTQKAALRKWIADGAKWTIQEIDPVVYQYGTQPADNWIRRLTVTEYIETVRVAVGVDIAKEARELLPPDLRADGFSNTAYNLGVDLKHVESYAQLARIAAERIDAGKFAAQFTNSRSLNTDATTREWVEKMGRWLLRGPLEEREVTNYSGIATSVASAGGTFEEAVRYIVEAMLQSPRFIYRMEDQRGSGAVGVTPHELASRMSYIVWGGPPDQELLRAADAGELSDQAKLAGQLERMLRDERAVRQSQQFISQWLDLDRLANLQPDKQHFPDWTPQLAEDMRAETMAFFKHVVWDQQRPLSELLNARLTFASAPLARMYGLPQRAAGASAESPAMYDLADVPARGGLLTHGSVLTVGGDEASMVTRGLFVMHELLRGVVKDPPPCVDTNPPPTKSGLTQRGIAQQRIANANCGGCHSKFEPLAFGLEKFNGIGGYQERDEHGNPLRDDGQILFPGTAEPVAYETSRQLMDLLAGSPRVKESITWKLTQFAIGRPLGPADVRLMSEIHQSAQNGGGTYAATVKAIIMSDLVQTTRLQPARLKDTP